MGADESNLKAQKKLEPGLSNKIQEIWDEKPIIERKDALIEDDPASKYEEEQSVVESVAEDCLQPVVFHWNHGGTNVFLVTSHDNWQAEHQLHRSQRDFTTILHLPPGIHWYKFIVDEVWSCARDQPYRQETNGGYVNYVKVELASDLSLNEDDPFSTSPAMFGAYYSRKQRREVFDESFSQKFPHPSFFGVIPEAPSHLGKILLNEEPGEGLAVRKPSHVEIEHLYLAQHVPNDITTLGLTTRYRDKTYTTVYYRTKPPK